MPYDYTRDCDAPSSGLDALIETITLARAECDAALVFDNGDFMQGNPMMDVIAPADAWRKQNVHPMISAMNAVGYDAVAVGNHEFNFGLEVLKDALSGLACPYLCANVLDIETGAPWVPPWTILEKPVTMSDGTTATLKIGVIAFAPPQIPIWDRLSCGGRISAEPIVATALAEVPKLRAAGADIVVALCHSGLGEVHDAPDIENAAIPLAAVDGIDAMIMGHTHLTFPNNGPSDGPVDATRGSLHGKPAVMPKALARSLGVIDLTAERTSAGWKLAAFDVSHRTPSPISGGLLAVPAIARAHEATLSHIRTPIGSFAGPFQSYFSCVTNCATMRVINDAQRRLARATLASTRYADLPLLSAAAPFKAGGRMGADHFIDIAEGPVAMRHVAELYIYPNAICIAPFSGREIADWLERSAGMFKQITKGGGPQALINSDFPSYNFDVIDGLTYRFDLTQPSRFDVKGAPLNADSRRVRDLLFDGRPIDPDAQFMVASNSYRIGGGGTFFSTDQEREIINPNTQARDAIAAHIRAASPILTEARNTWGFSPISGASGLFQTSPRAVGFARDTLGLNIIEFHPSDDGYVMGEIAFD